MKIRGSSDLGEDVRKKDFCVNCGACVGLCPYFVSYKGKIAQLFPCTITEGRCHALCPKTEIDLSALSENRFGIPYDASPLGHVRRVWKTRAGGRLSGQTGFQNGGTVTALTLAAMEAGMIDAAALTRRQGLDPEPFLARTPEDVLSATGSKYMASPTLASVNEYTRENGRKLGVVGTPCQMTALTRMRMNPLDRADFKDPVALMIGLFCTWALDTRKFAGHLGGAADEASILSMDVPPPPADVMSIKTRSGDVRVPLEEIRKAIPLGCAICPDMTAELSDLSVGAYEGDPSWNTLIVRTEIGDALIDQAVAMGYLEREPLPETALNPLVRGAQGKKERAIGKALEMEVLNADPETGRSALILDAHQIQRLLKEEACQS